jgi:hypothetical protein
MRSDVRVDETVAREVAAAYLGARCRRDSLVVAAFAQLVAESDALFRSITRTDDPAAVRVSFTRCEQPYRDAQELITSVWQLRELEVTTVAVDRERHHPLMGNEIGGSFDRFRAVHDALGHGRLRLGFDRDGEYATWLSQERFHSPLARRALATELHGQHSARWTTGEVAAPRATLLDTSLVRRAAAVGRVDLKVRSKG